MDRLQLHKTGLLMVISPVVFTLSRAVLVSIVTLHLQSNGNLLGSVNTVFLSEISSVAFTSHSCISSGLVKYNKTLSFPIKQF